ncbi:Uncharacterised protein [Mycobacteroides abscessus subsp. abscessus]|nr:Uncharacterised protein [Mycobacteroides abscessus subsp. abscessus]SHY62588.1 Uncharacterised protein [Mycobacteroides abscessus subsp. abscessus]SHY72229.1 Uncharacterised protein [Mycobacteroides abscessus subsp. abscessus]SIA15676.1 Uncharacterised protein [Mycobacteroides abscessus subsp. abscessus]SIB17416.1 Uncharacterised protein [Mycobacteroides abscessus subsp. abscessus]
MSLNARQAFSKNEILELFEIGAISRAEALRGLGYSAEQVEAISAEIDREVGLI